jgi:hypothetical protein
MNVSIVSRERECDEYTRGNVARFLKGPKSGHVEQHETQTSSVVPLHFDRFKQPHDENLDAGFPITLAGGYDMTI